MSASTDGIAVLPVQSEGNRTLQTSGPCLRGTVQALTSARDDGKMDPSHVNKATAEAATFAGEILAAYNARYGHFPSGAGAVPRSDIDSFPTGLLYGCVQSGKTRAITLTAAMLFDNGIRIVIVLTSNNVELVKQTAARLKYVDDVQFITSLDYDDDRWTRDARHIEAHIAQTGLLVVCQKERHHQQKLIDFLRQINAGRLPAVVFDDEADQATPDTTQAARSAGKGNAPKQSSTTFRKTIRNDAALEEGESIVETLPLNVFVQVTATPYALLLQHIEHPLRPKFTCLIEPGAEYMGGDWFFPARFSDEDIGPPLVEVPAAEATALAAGAIAEPPEMLRKSIAYFCVAAAAHEISTGTRAEDGYSFLCHTSSRKVDHAHLERLVANFLEQISSDLERDVAGDVADAFNFAQREMQRTAALEYREVPYSQLKAWILRKLPLRAMRVINAETDSLNFTPGLNFLIGGNILGRGLTIKRLLVTYYMRSARTTQMDTMLQHARMFGYRRDIASLVRVFLPRTSIQRFLDIVRSEAYLRQLIASGRVGAMPVRVAQNLKATRKNILDTRSLEGYAGGEHIYPYEPEYLPQALGGVTERISARLREAAFKGPIELRTPTQITWDLFEELVSSVRIREDDESRWVATAIVNVAHALRKNERGDDNPLPLLWVRDTQRQGSDKDKKLLTGVAGGDDPRATDSRYSNRVVLMMFLHSGQGWADVPFWIPTVMLPEGAGMFLFSTDQ